MLKTTTTRSPLPPWFPLTSPRPSFEKPPENSTITTTTVSPKNSSSVLTKKSFEPPSPVLTTDCPDPEHNNCGNSHWVKVPKVPYNYDYIKNNSKPHFPPDLLGDRNNDDIDFHDPSTDSKSSTPAPKKPTVSIQVLPNFTQYCPPARSRNLFWNWTLAVSISFFYAHKYCIVHI